MKSVIGIVITATVWAVLATGTVSAQSGPPSAAGDLDLLEGYVARDRSYSDEERAAATAYIAQVRASGANVTAAEMSLHAAHVAALTGNGHSFLLSGFWTHRYPRIPYRLGVIGGRVYVMGAADEPGLVGREVVAVAGVPIERIRRAYASYQGGRTGFTDQFFPLFAETPAMLEAAGLTRPSATVCLTLAGPGGVTEERHLTPSLQPLGGMAAFLIPSALQSSGSAASAPMGGPQPLYLQGSGAAFVRNPAPEADALYVAMHTTRDAENVKIADFLSETMAQVRSDSPRNLILDLRFNMGGDLNTTRNFMSALPGLLPPDGRIYAITAGRTFSAAISSLGYLEQAAPDKVVIVGEPVGDELEFWAEGDTVSLPWSGSMLLYATERHNYQTGCQEADCHGPVRNHPIRVASLEPDIATPMTIEAFLQGRDPAMEAIIAAEAQRR